VRRAALNGVVDEAVEIIDVPGRDHARAGQHLSRAGRKAFRATTGVQIDDDGNVHEPS
jgi:hypothetical protein